MMIMITKLIADRFFEDPYGRYGHGHVSKS